MKFILPIGAWLVIFLLVVVLGCSKHAQPKTSAQIKTNTTKWNKVK